MKKFQFWTVMLVLLFSLALTGTVQAATPAPNSSPVVASEDEGVQGAATQGAGVEAVATGYVFSQSTGTWAPITGGTVLCAAGSNCDDNNYLANNIGFTFYYNGVAYTQFSVQNNGFIAMGATVSSSYVPISGGTTNNIIAALGFDLKANPAGELRYELLGTTPNQVLIIQWSDYGAYASTMPNDEHFYFQIRLYETSDIVEVIYGGFTKNATDRAAQVGLRGNANTDFNNRTTTTDWSASTAGVNNTDTMALTTLVLPPSGLTFTWTPQPYVAIDPDYLGTACRGSDILYPLTAINYTSNPDTLDIAASGFVWDTSVDPAALALPAKGSGAVNAFVHVPWASAAGDTDVATITATGQGSGLFDTATLYSSSALLSGYTDYANSPADRGTRNHGLVYWDGKLYKIGGWGGATATYQPWLDIYDIASNTWTTGADMPAGRYWIDCEAIDLTGSEPKIYCAGGYTSSAQTTLYIYDINTNTWTTGTALPAGRYSYSSVVYNNKYYVIGGYSGSTYYNSMVVYDPATATWDSTLATMTNTRRYFSAGLIGGKIYAAGGYNGSYLTSTEAYDFGTNTWSAVAAMPYGWTQAADGVMYDRYLLMVGGYYGSTSTASNTALIYDAVNNTWSYLPYFNHVIYASEGAVDGSGNFWIVSGRLYENGSFSYSTYTTKADECLDCVAVDGVDFTVDPVVPRPSMPATFSAFVADGSPAIVYEWDFGDGDTATGQVVEHTFATAGTYTVVLTATNCDGTSTDTVSYDVLVEAGPLAEISPLFLSATQCPDCETTQTVNVCNNGDADLLWDVYEENPLLGGARGGIDSLSGSFIVFDPSVGGNTEYTDNTAQTFCFRTESFTNDWEYRYAQWLKFPADWTVTNAYLVGTPYCDSASSWGAMTWGYETAPYEIQIYHPVYNQNVDHCVATYCVDVTTGAGGPDALVSWYYDGDGYNYAPHHPCSLDVYTPASMSAEPCDEAVNPQAEIPYLDLSPLTWVRENPVSGTVIPGACEVVTVTFDSSDLLPDVYTGTLVFETNDTLNLEVDVPVELIVAGPPTNPSFTFTPGAPNIGQDVSFFGAADALVPVEFTWDFGDGTTGTGPNPVHAYDGWGTYTVTMTASACDGSVSTTGEVYVQPCWTFTDESFEGSFPPEGWTVIDNAGSGCVWTRNDNFATPRPNYAGGDGFAADADSDYCGSGTTMDTELRIASLNLTGLHTANLHYVTSYNDIGTGGDLADVDVSIDGGATWTTLLRWDEDHDPNGPGQVVDLDLTPYAGYADVLLRYHYWVATYDWWWEVDQVSVTACYVPGATPDIAVDPVVLEQTLQANNTADQMVNIANNGLAWLNWGADIGCGTPVGWLEIDPYAGSVPAYSNTDVTVTFDSTGLDVGTYVAPICVNSDDPDTPTVTISTTLIVTGTPDIAVNMPALDVQLPTDATVTLDGQICNVGDATLNWALYEIPGSLLARTQNVEYKGTPAPGSIDSAPAHNTKVVAANPDALGDLLFELDIEAITADTQILGVEFDGTYYWATGGNSGLDPNKLYQIDTAGVLVGVFDQASDAGWGWRDLAFDGTYLYASDSGVIEQIDPATGLATGVTITSPINPARALAYDPATDHFWAANWDSNIYEFDRSGVMVNSFAPVGLSTYGMAWDPFSEGGPFLWLWSQDGPDPLLMASQLDPTTGLLTGVSFLGSGVVGEMAGGAAITDQLVPGYAVFLGANQGVSDRVGVYELVQVSAQDIPWLSESPITGTLPAGECLDEFVTFDSAGLASGVYNGSLLVESDDPYEPQITLPVTLTVVPMVEFVYYDLEDVVQPGEAVYLAGEFNGWDPAMLALTPNGDFSTFTVEIPLALGTHEYKYIVYTDTVPTGPAHWNWLQSYPGYPPVNRTVDVTGDMTVEDYRDIVPGWYVLQWPPETTTTVHIPTENIYGQLWAEGLTYEEGEQRGLLAELGYGTDADPSAWTTWASMAWGSQVGDNDEYLSTIIPDETGVFSYAVRFNGNWGVGNPNDVWYYGDTSGGEYDPADAGVLTVLGPSIELVKTVGTDPNVCAATDSILVVPGTEVVYCYTVTNTGDLALVDHDLYDDQLGDLLVDFPYTLEPGASAFITATAVITQHTTNTATWTAWDGDTHFAEATDTVTVKVNEADLSLTKTGPATVGVGETFTYLLTVANAGLDTATETVLVDTLPEGVAFVSATAPCVEAEGVVTCELGDLAIDETVEIEIVVTAPATVGTLTNDAVVSSAAFDPDETNNSASFDTEVVVKAYFTFLPMVYRNY